MILKRLGKLFYSARNQSNAVLDEAVASTDSASAYYERAMALRQAGKAHEAMSSLNRAIALAPDFAAAYFDLGDLLREQGQLNAAVLYYEKAIALQPEQSHAHNNLGLVFMRQDLLDDAVASFRTAIRIRPDNAIFHMNLAESLHKQGVLGEALTSADAAIALAPAAALPHVTKGAALKGQGRLDEAESSLRRALALEPGRHATQFVLATLLLARGHLTEGWALFGQRFYSGSPTSKRSFDLPYWAGEDLRDKTILVWGDQGVGDDILFANLLPDIIASSHRCVVECTPKLVPLLACSFPGALIVPRTDPPNSAARDGVDLQIALADAARWLRPEVTSFPQHGGYLTAEQTRVAYWRTRLAKLGPGRKIGFAWRSHLTTTFRSLYYTSLDQWGPIFAEPGVHFVNLQYGQCSDELAMARERFGVPIHVFDEVDLFNDLAEAAALNQALDFVISAPTATAFLSAAVGVPTWMMSYATPWQTLGTDHIPWFPAMRCFPRRWDQPWVDVIYDIARALRGDHVAEPTASTCKVASIAPNPDAAEDFKNRGNQHFAKGELEAAADCYHQAIASDPAYAEAVNNLGLVRQRQGSVEEAMALFLRALVLKPNLARAHLNCGNIQMATGLLDAAALSFRQALSIDPALAQAHNNLGNLLQTQHRLDDALISFRTAVQLEPNFAVAHFNIGDLLREQGNPQHALGSFQRAIALDPNLAEARFSLASTLLSCGRLADGWSLYKSRFDIWEGNALPRAQEILEWSNEPLADKAILVWSDQGVGDEILFANLFPDLVARARRCVIECAHKLVPLFARSFPDAVVVPKMEPPHPSTRDGINLQIAAADAARWLRCDLQSFPPHRGYLTPDPERTEYWRARLTELGPGLRIGFAWRSNLCSGRRSLHYTSLDQWGPVFAVPGVHFVNLQYDQCADEIAAARKRFGIPLHMFDEVDLFDDLAEAAALKQALDLVISAPTATAFLSAAVGVPTWMMSYSTPWQTLGTDHVPWFPAMRCFPRRWDQPWEEIIAHVAAALESVPRGMAHA